MSGNPAHEFTEKIVVRKRKNTDIPKGPKQYKIWKQQKVASLKQKKEDKLIRLLMKQKKHEQSLKRAQVKMEEEAKEIKKIGRPYTVSIAIPGSILDNAQSPELRTYLAGQIGRAAVVFNVDEIIVFNECGEKDSTTEGEFTGVGKRGNATVQLARILQYLECPQYLRKSFFPSHKDLQYAGLLNPLDSPHHMKINDVVQYREGVVLDKKVPARGGSYVNVGLYRPLQIDRQIKPGMRVTVKMDYTYSGVKKYKGKVVSPSEPRTNRGLYWGYTVRIASSLSSVFTESPFKEPYDLTIGTSEKGTPVDTFSPPKEYKHSLIVFGGLKGLEASVEDDDKLDLDDPSVLFQHYLNTCPGQGSGTIRTEEAVLISLAALRPMLQKHDTNSETNIVNMETNNVDMEMNNEDIVVSSDDQSEEEEEEYSSDSSV